MFKYIFILFFCFSLHCETYNHHVLGDINEVRVGLSLKDLEVGSAASVDMSLYGYRSHKENDHTRFYFELLPFVGSYNNYDFQVSQSHDYSEQIDASVLGFSFDYHIMDFFVDLASFRRIYFKDKNGHQIFTNSFRFGSLGAGVDFPLFRFSSASQIRFYSAADFRFGYRPFIAGSKYILNLAHFNKVGLKRFVLGATLQDDYIENGESLRDVKTEFTVNFYPFDSRNHSFGVVAGHTFRKAYSDEQFSSHIGNLDLIIKF